MARPFRLRIHLGAFALATSTAGCPGFGSEVPGVPSVPTWDGEVQALLESRCTSCHTNPPQNDAPDTFRLDRYDRAEAGGAIDGAFEKRDRILARAVDNTPSVMPKGGPPLPDGEKAILKAWIVAGAPKTDPTWTREIRELMATNCAICHTDPPQNGAPEGFRFDRYDRAEAGGTHDGAFEKRERILARAVRNEPKPMPPSTAPVPSPLSDVNKQLLERWIEAGAKK
ncbi:MAG: hypothetical protein HY791_40100 [Deltaproteobacteria bacterium]|nr:hypothetical protein [Deltaproteobacteria bacterium]